MSLQVPIAYYTALKSTMSFPIMMTLILWYVLRLRGIKTGKSRIPTGLENAVSSTAATI